LYFVSIIAGLATVLAFWFIASYLVARVLVGIESRHPHLAGSKAMRTGEIVACGLVVVSGLALAFWVAFVLVTEVK